MPQTIQDIITRSCRDNRTDSGGGVAMIFTITRRHRIPAQVRCEVFGAPSLFLRHDDERRNVI